MKLKNTKRGTYKDTKQQQYLKIHRLLKRGTALQIDQAIFDYWELKNEVVKPYKD